DFNKNLLGLQDVIIKNIEEKDDVININIKLEVKEHQCPCCKTKTKYIHDYRNQIVKDIPIRGKKCNLILQKRRYICKNCGKKFFEKNKFLPRYYQSTNRLSMWIIKQLGTYSFKAIAKQTGLSSYTVMRRFDMLSFHKPKLPTVLSIDEFKGNTADEKYQVILTDPVNKKVLDILKSRTKYQLTQYFKRYTQEQRDSVEYFVCDMYSPYRDICETYFKNATLVTDKYHWLRQGIWALDAVRVRIQKEFSKSHRIYFKHSKSILTKSEAKLEEEQRLQLSVMLGCSADLSTAHFLKEDLYEILNDKNKERAEKNLRFWIQAAKESEIPEFKNAITAYTNWFDSIINSCGSNITNGYTEGCNNKIKVIKRNAYGYRDFERFRKRILHAFACSA
ncbi:MAG: ISL3 family transposase, partial [Oscillospiraceae bacterium]